MSQERDDVPEVSSDVRDVLMRTLDDFEQTRAEELKADEVIESEYLMIVGASVIRDPKTGKGRTVRHWHCTNHPHFVFVGLMQELAIKLAVEASVPRSEDEEDE